MKESIKSQNRDLIVKWIEINPNFSDIKFEDNTVIFSDGSKIYLGEFLLTSLLENKDFTSNFNLMDEYLLYKILYVNTEIYKFYNADTNINEYIKDIKLTDYGNVLITTNVSKEETKGVMTNVVLMTYSSLLNSSPNGKVTVDSLFKKIGITR